MAGVSDAGVRPHLAINLPSSATTGVLEGREESSRTNNLTGSTTDGTTIRAAGILFLPPAASGIAGGGISYVRKSNQYEKSFPTDSTVAAMTCHPKSSSLELKNTCW